jgi:glycosyltransferase involved in cell wall biosynthesis
MPLRVELISPFPPLKGGIARFSGRLADACADAGCDMHPVPFRRLYPRWLLKGRPAGDPSLPQPHGLRSRLDLMNPVTWLSTALDIRRRRPDLVVVAYWTAAMAPLCAVVRAVSGIRTVVVLHNFSSHEKLPGERLLQRLLVRSADAFVTLSGSVRRELEAAGISRPAMTLFHPCYEPDGPPPLREDARRSLGIPATANLLLFFGYVRRYKGLDLLLDAMPGVLRRNPAVHLVVAGEFIGGDAFFRNMAERLGIAGNVSFRPGYVPAAGVGTLFAAADAVVLPYRSATQSGVASLALGYGVPVIACDTGGLAGQVGHGSGSRIVRTPGSGALTEGILGFFDNVDPAAAAEDAGNARTALSWKVFAERLAAFLETISRGSA